MNYLPWSTPSAGTALLASLTCVMALPARAGVALTQQATVVADAPPCPPCSVTATFLGPTAVGDVLIAMGGSYSTLLDATRIQGGGVPANAGSTTGWQLAVYETTTDDIEIWYGVVTAASSTGISLTDNVSPQELWLWVGEFSGLAADPANVSGLVDATGWGCSSNRCGATVYDPISTNGAGNTTSNIGPSLLTTTQPDDLIVMGVTVLITRTFGSPTEGPWLVATPLTDHANYQQAEWYQMGALATSYAPQITETPDAGHWDLAVAAFRTTMAPDAGAHPDAGTPNDGGSALGPASFRVGCGCGNTELPAAAGLILVAWLAFRRPRSRA